MGITIVQNASTFRQPLNRLCLEEPLLNKDEVIISSSSSADIGQNPMGPLLMDSLPNEGKKRKKLFSSTVNSANDTRKRNPPRLSSAMWTNQLKVVLWKNLIIRKRHWFLTLCEALVPPLLFLLIAYGRSKITSLSKQEIVDVTYNEKKPISYANTGFDLAEVQLFYSPSDKYFDDIIYRVQKKFQLTNNNKRGFANQQQLLDEYIRWGNGSVIAIIFNSKGDSKEFDYTIRHHKPYFAWKTGQLYENEFLFAPSQGSAYQWEGFLVLQEALDTSFIEKEAEKQQVDVPKIELNSLEFPYPPYKADSAFSTFLIHYLSLITLFSFIFVCPAVLKRVVEEKYSGIKELMRMVGMHSWMLWLGWFIYSILPMILSVCLVVLILKVDLFQVSYPVIEYTSSGVLVLFLLLYCTAVTINCFFLSTLFYKPTLATLVGLLLWILTYFLPKYLIGENNMLSFRSNMVLMLFPNMALHYGYLAVAQYEIREIGVQWTNWHLPGASGFNEVTMLNVCLMLVLDCMVYMLLALYVDGINPGKYGVPKSIFFPIKWMCSCLRTRNSVEVGDCVESYHLEEIERGKSSNKAIELINVYKKFGHKTVVKNLSMGISENEITILLGHNGAGKSTTMGMITGMLTKTAGLILINGEEIGSHSDVSECIGLCTQHNLFFPDLTVAEHLKFFALLKGKTSRQAEAELASLLKVLHLEDKRNDLAHTLSGGMKRKLCLGMAVIGGSKILILDEPSSGMDPQSRRDMWDLLLHWRRSRTILITTHFMEEADALGDRIAIMNDGELKCFDTPMKLKKIYDTGYNLNLLIKQGENVEEVVDNLSREIGHHIEHLKVKSVNGNEVEFLLPFGNNYIKMFEHLESNKELFKIDNISFTHTTLEDVFLNSKVSVDQTDDNRSEFDAISSDGSGHYTLTTWALLYKRYRFISRKFLTYLIPSGIALVFLLLCIFLGQESAYQFTSGGPPLKVALKTYGKTKVFLNTTGEPNLLKMETFYNNLVNEQRSDFSLVNDVSEAIIKEGVNNLPFYRHHMIAAAELATRTYGRETYLEATALFNNLAKHSAPISVNLITNSFAKLVLGANYSIASTNHPLESINSATTAEELSKDQISLLWLMIMPLGFLFFLGSFIYFPYVELSTKFTQLQFMTGLHPSFYWLTTFLCDIVIYAVFALFMSVITLAWTPFCGLKEFGALYAILMLYGISGIPLSYLFARKKSFSGAYASFIIVGLMLGVLLTVITLALEWSGDPSYVSKGEALAVFFLLFCPQFGFTYLGVLFSRKVISNYNFNHMDALKMSTVCMRETHACCSGKSPACDAYQSYASVLSPQMYYMILGAAFFLAVNIVLDCYWPKKLINRLRNVFKKNDEGGSGKENLNTSSNRALNTDTLRVKRLKKSYSGRQVLNNINLHLKKGECMGILGVNGAGKTTTFRMLTKEEVKDNGEIQINNINIDQSQYLSKLGYCPQNDALNFSLTGRDILITMAMLRGIGNNNNNHENNKVVDQFLDVFGLKEIADIPCEQYSGGNKRKLSFAVAVIGFPEFILLDEPTNGVDPISRRKFWSLIKHIREKKKNSFILTSHSMAECEAVCNDLVIMKRGAIEKEGTISKLKKEISGFNIRLKLKQDLLQEGNDEVDNGAAAFDDDGSVRIRTIEDLKQYLSKEYPEGEFRDEHSGLIHFYIKDENKKWSELFKQFDNLKEKWPNLIEDYSISEASLEDVFLAVANNTSPEDETVKRGGRQ